MSPKWKIVSRSAITGMAAMIGLVLVYLLVISLLESWGHATRVLLDDAFFVGALSTGFGIQIGLFSYIKRAARMPKVRGAKIMSASGAGASTVSMVACCLHHVGDLVPLIGFSARPSSFPIFATP